MSVSTLPFEIANRRRRNLVDASIVLLLGSFVFLLVWQAGLIFAWVGLGLVVLLGAALARPEIATIAAVFALYANLLPATAHFYGLPKILAILFFLVLLLPVLYYIGVCRESVRTDAVLALMLVYLIVQIASVVFSQDVAAAFTPISRFVLEGMVLYFLILNAVRTPAILRRCLWAIIIAGAMLGSLSLIQDLTRTYDNQYGGLALTRTTNELGEIREPRLRVGDNSLTDTDTRPRAMGSIGDPNFYGQILAALLPIALLRVWSESRTQLRVLAALAVFAIVGGILLTFSRGAGLAVVALALALVPLGYIRLRYGLIAIATAAIVLALSPDYLQRIKTVAELESTSMRSADASMQERATIMMASVRVFLDHPVLGVGAGQAKDYIAPYSNLLGYTRATPGKAAHNIYLEILVDTGVLGFAAFAAIVSVAICRLHRLRRYWLSRHPEHSHTLAGLLLAVVAFLLTGMFLHRADARYFWLIIAMCGAAIHNYRVDR